MSDYIGVVTNAGQIKIAAAIGGTALNLTTVRLGDGNGAPITPNPAMTNLVRRVGNAYPIIGAGPDPTNPNHWRVSALIPVEDGPFDIREIGVFDNAGTMIAIAKHVLVEKRSPAQGAAVELITDIVFPVSETAQVTVQLQPAAAVSIFQMLRAGFTVVESATAVAPPADPVLGRTHVVPVGATGAWSGFVGYLVQWNGTVWVAVDAPNGFHVVDQSKDSFAGNRWLERTVDGWVPGVTRLLQRQPGNYAIANGSANALTVTLDPPLLAYAPGLSLRVKIASTNTGPVTIKADGLGAVPIVNPDGSALIEGALVAGQIAELVCIGAGGFQFMGSKVGAGPYTLGRIRLVTASETWNRPAGCRAVLVELLGGGGGGGGAQITSSGQISQGAGGGGGGYARKFIVGPPATVAIAIGNGGNGGGGAAQGQNGGTTSFGPDVSATGGIGGNYYPAGTGANASAAGAGGEATGGDVNARGTPGIRGVSLSAQTGYGGAGGSSQLGGGGFGPATANTPGGDASGFGAGGGGAISVAGAAQVGGKGSPGAIIIWEFY